MRQVATVDDSCPSSPFQWMFVWSLRLCGAVPPSRAPDRCGSTCARADLFGERHTDDGQPEGTTANAHVQSHTADQLLFCSDPETPTCPPPLADVRATDAPVQSRRRMVIRTQGEVMSVCPTRSLPSPCPHLTAPVATAFHTAMKCTWARTPNAGTRTHQLVQSRSPGCMTGRRDVLPTSPLSAASQCCKWARVIG